MSPLDDKELTLLETSRRVLELCFMWPSRDEMGDTISKKTWCRLAILNFFRLLFFIQSITFLYFAYKAELPEAVTLLVQLVAYSVLWTVCNIYIFIQKDLIQLLRELSDFSFFRRVPEVFITKQLIMEKITKVYNMLIMGFIAINSFSMLITKRQCETNKDLGEYHVVCGTLVLTVMPFPVEHEYIKGLIHLFQLIVVGNVFQGGCVWFYMIFEINEYIVVRMQHLNTLIEDVFAGNDEEEKRRKFNVCAKYHSKIIYWSKTLDRIFTSVMMMHITATATVIGLLANVIIDYHRPGDIAHVLGWVVTLFLACLAGQRSVNTNESITIALCDTKWYEADVDIQKDFRFMLEMSQRPLYLNAGPFGVLSYPLYSAILKTSYSYLTVLRR